MHSLVDDTVLRKFSLDGRNGGMVIIESISFMEVHAHNTEWQEKLEWDRHGDMEWQSSSAVGARCGDSSESRRGIVLREALEACVISSRLPGKVGFRHFGLRSFISFNDFIILTIDSGAHSSRCSASRNLPPVFFTVSYTA
jgi:hypothetical protein